MDTGDVSIATITLARSAAEETALRVALSSLALHAMPVAVADGGSRPEFVEFLRTLPSFSLAEPTERGLVGQVKGSLRAASGQPSTFILYTEADKQLFIERKLAGFISSAADDHDVGVVLASRDQLSFDTFPEFQRFTEGAFNRMCAEVIGEPGDYCYGPFLLNRALIAPLERITRNVGWGWRPYMFGVARRLGYRVVH